MAEGNLSPGKPCTRSWLKDSMHLAVLNAIMHGYSRRLGCLWQPLLLQVRVVPDGLDRYQSGQSQVISASRGSSLQHKACWFIAQCILYLHASQDDFTTVDLINFFVYMYVYMNLGHVRFILHTVLGKCTPSSAGWLVHAMEDQLQLYVMTARWCWSLAASHSPWSEYTTLQELNWQSSSGTRGASKLWAGLMRKI